MSNEIETSAKTKRPTTVDESSESENETEPARAFLRRVSTSKTLNGSVSKQENNQNVFAFLEISVRLMFTQFVNER